MDQVIFEQALTRTVGDLTEIIGGLSAPGKMPWVAFSTPADECQVGGALSQIEGTPCFNCYAKKGRYSFQNVKKALARRFEAMSQDGWGEHMAALLSKKAKNVSASKRYFRWFDSGDIQSVRDLEVISGIAEYVPSVSFWLPTQERAYVSKWLRQHGTIPDNLAVRISSTKVGQAQKSQTGLASMVSHTESDCPASEQGGQCLDCRVCWDKDIPLLTYPWH